MAEAWHRRAKILAAARVAFFALTHERDAHAGVGAVPSAHSLATVADSALVFDRMRAGLAESACAEEHSAQRIDFDTVELQVDERLFHARGLRLV